MCVEKLLRLSANSISGLIFIAIGTGFATISTTYQVGTLTAMGPGFFPLVLGVLLAILGAIVMLSATHSPEKIEHANLRPVVILLGGVILFALIVRGAGLIPAVALLVFTSSLAGERLPWGQLSLIAGGFAIFCYFAFVKGLGLPFDAFGHWFGG